MEDRGERHCMSLSRLATGDITLLGNNHVVPVLQELVHDDMIFAVFPLLSWGFDHPWFYRFTEVLDAGDNVQVHFWGMLLGVFFFFSHLVWLQVCEVPPPFCRPETAWLETCPTRLKPQVCF